MRSRTRFIIWGAILAVTFPPALMRRFPYLGQPTVPVSGFDSIQVHGSNATKITAEVAYLLKRSRTFVELVQEANGLHILATRSGPPDTVAWYDDWSKTIFIVIPSYAEPVLEDRLPLIGHEIAHQLFRREDVQNSLVEEAFCRWLAQVIGSEATSTPIDSLDTLALETIALYKDEQLWIGDQRFVVAVGSLESRGALPAGSSETAAALLSRISDHRQPLI